MLSKRRSLNCFGNIAVEKLRLGKLLDLKGRWLRCGVEGVLVKVRYGSVGG